MTSLLSLYTTILVPVLSEWITDRQLCSLDTAFCDKNRRSNFLTILTKCSIVHLENSDYNEDRPHWILMRGIRLMNFDLGQSEYYTIPPVLKTLLVRSKHIGHISSPCCAKFLHLIEQEGLTTSSLELIHCYDQSMLVSIVSAMGGVAALDTTFVMTEQTAASIAACSPNLKRIRAFEESKINHIVENCDLEVIQRYDLWNVFEYLSTDQFHHNIFECDLRRVSIHDTHTVVVCSKYYHITSLTIVFAQPEQVEALSPFLFTLQKAHIMRESYALINAIALKCYRLTELDFVDISVTIPEWELILVHSNNLTNIRLVDVDIDSHLCLQSIACHCRHLTSLLFDPPSRENIVDRVLLMVFKECTELVELVFGCRVACTATGVFCVIQNAQHLVLHFIVDGLIFHRKNIAGLNQITLNTYITLTDNKFDMILGSNSDLRKLEIRCTSKFRTNVFAKLAEKMPLLGSLRVDGGSNSELPVAHFESLASCKHLTSLELYCVKCITHEVIELIVKDKPNFVKLTVCDVPTLSGEVLHVIAKYCPAIRFVNMSHCKLISDNDVIVLLRQCSMLQGLDLTGCYSVTGAVSNFVKPHGRWRYFKIQSCQLKKSDVEALEAATGILCSI